MTTTRIDTEHRHDGLRLSVFISESDIALLMVAMDSAEWREVAAQLDRESAMSRKAAAVAVMLARLEQIYTGSRAPDQRGIPLKGDQA